MLAASLHRRASRARWCRVEGGSVAGSRKCSSACKCPPPVAAKPVNGRQSAEQEVNDLYILAFKVDKDDNTVETFDYFVTASKNAPTTTNGGGRQQSLRVRAEEQTFVMVANAQGTPAKVNEQIAALAANSVGHKKTMCWRS